MRTVTRAVAGAAAGSALVVGAVLGHVATGGALVAPGLVAVLVVVLAAAGARVGARMRSRAGLLGLAAASQALVHAALWVGAAPGLEAGAAGAHHGAAGLAPIGTAASGPVHGHGAAWPAMLAAHVAAFVVVVLVTGWLVPALARSARVAPRLMGAVAAPVRPRRAVPPVPAPTRLLPLRIAPAAPRRGPPLACAPA